MYRKPTDTGLLLHFQSHVDNRYKKGLVNTMVDRAHRLSSTEEAFTKECDKLRITFSKLRYPNTLVNSTIRRFMQETDSAARRDFFRTISLHEITFNDQRVASAMKLILWDL